jgi:hypothetical protein
MSDSTGSSSPIPPRSRHTSHLRLLLLLGVSLAVVIAAVVAVAWLRTEPTPPVHCRHPGCGHVPAVPTPSVQPAPAPPLLPSGLGAEPNYVPAQPVRVREKLAQTDPRFTASDGSWSVQYPSELQPLAADAPYVSFTLTDRQGQKTNAALFGVPAHDRSAEDIVHALIQKSCPDATLGYHLPNAMVGYQAGYGEYDDFTPQSGNASYATGRALAIVAIKHGVALGVLALGPKYEFKPGDPTSHPSAADFRAAGLLGPYVNSFMWKGDPPR